MTIALGGQNGGSVGEDELGSQQRCLLPSPMGQLATADAAVEPEVVPDHGAGASLAADGPRLDDQRVQAFGAPIDGRGETSRPGT